MVYCGVAYHALCVHSCLLFISVCFPLPEIGTSSKNILAVATADEPQAVKSPHRTVGGQPRKTDDILSKLKHVEAQLNALEATAYNVQREIKLDSYKVHCAL